MSFIAQAREVEGRAANNYMEAFRFQTRKRSVLRIRVSWPTAVSRWDGVSQQTFLDRTPCAHLLTDFFHPWFCSCKENVYEFITTSAAW